MSTVFHGNLDLEQWPELSIFLPFFSSTSKTSFQRSYAFSPIKGTQLNNKYRLEITPSHWNLFIFFTIKYSNATYTSSVPCSPLNIGAFHIYKHICSYLPTSHKKKKERKSTKQNKTKQKNKTKKKKEKPPMLLVLLFYVDYFCLSLTVLMLFVSLFYAWTISVLFLFIVFCELVSFSKLI